MHTSLKSIAETNQKKIIKCCKFVLYFIVNDRTNVTLLARQTYYSLSDPNSPEFRSFFDEQSLLQCFIYLSYSEHRLPIHLLISSSF